MPRGVYKRKPKSPIKGLSADTKIVDLLVALDKLLPMPYRKLLRSELERVVLQRRIDELEKK